MSDFSCVVFGIERSDWSDTSTARDVLPDDPRIVKWLAEATLSENIRLCSVKIHNEDVDDVMTLFEGIVPGCEVYVNAPCPVPLATPPSMLEFQPLDTTRLQQQFRTYGLAFIESCLHSSIIERLLAAANRQMDTAMEEVRRQALEPPFCRREIASRGTFRYDLLLDKDEISDIVEGELPWTAAIRGVFGDDVVLHLSVVYSLPGAQDQGWHADGYHISHDAEWSNDGADSDLADPYAACVFVPVIDLDTSTGFTQFWPRSHAFKGLVGLGPCAPVIGATWDGICAAGSAIVYDYRLLHRGMANKSTNTRRPVLQFLYHKPWYKEVNNYGIDSLWIAS